MYSVTFSNKAQTDLVKLKRREPLCFKKAISLLNELAVHPRTGTGKPEQLKGNRNNQWSRRISHKHRLVYEIRETEVVVLVLTALGHYDEK